MRNLKKVKVKGYIIQTCIKLPITTIAQKLINRAEKPKNCDQTQ